MSTLRLPPVQFAHYPALHLHQHICRNHGKCYFNDEGRARYHEIIAFARANGILDSWLNKVAYLARYGGAYPVLILSPDRAEMSMTFSLYEGNTPYRGILAGLLLYEPPNTQSSGQAPNFTVSNYKPHPDGQWTIHT